VDIRDSLIHRKFIDCMSTGILTDCLTQRKNYRMFDEEDTQNLFGTGDPFILLVTKKNYRLFGNRAYLQFVSRREYL
jgi:hypothetical protein